MINCEEMDLTILMCGDFAPCRRWSFNKADIDVFGDFLSHIKSSDLAFLNLETPATNIGKPIFKDGPNLRCNPDYLRLLKKAGFKLIGLANNHIGDYGPDSIIDCIGCCEENDLAFVGAGSNLTESQKIYYYKKNGTTVAFIAVCEHEFGIAKVDTPGTAPLDLIDNIRQIDEAKKNADFVIMTIHGGNEFFPFPRPIFRKQCNFYVDQGCDAVICHHPHVSGSYEVYKNKPIVYSLGNFLFDLENPPFGWNEGYAIKLNFCKSKHSINFEFLPYKQSFELGGIRLMDDNSKDNFLNNLEDYKRILENKKEYNQKWEEFCLKKRDNYLIVHCLPFYIRGLGWLLRRFNAEKILLSNTKRLATRLNYIRCESHRDVMIELLDMMLRTR